MAEGGKQDVYLWKETSFILSDYGFAAKELSLI